MEIVITSDLADPYTDKIASTAKTLRPLKDAFIGPGLMKHRTPDTLVNIRGLVPGTGGDAVFADLPTGEGAVYRRTELFAVRMLEPVDGEGGA